MFFCPFLSGKKGTERKPDKIATRVKLHPSRTVEMAETNPSISALACMDNSLGFFLCASISAEGGSASPYSRAWQRNARNCAYTRPRFWPPLSSDFVVKELFTVKKIMFYSGHNLFFT